MTNVTRRRPIVALTLTCLLVALVAIVLIALRGIPGQRERAAGQLGNTGVTVSLPGQPFGVAATPDNQWLLVSITANSSSPTAPDGLAVLRRRGERMSLVRVVHFTPGSFAAGSALSTNGSRALVALADSPSSVAVVDVRRAEVGSGHAVLGYITDGLGLGAIEVVLSKDNRYAFSTDENSATITVMRLPAASAPKYGAGNVVARIPVDSTPTGITLSPDGRSLYVVCQQSGPTFAAGGVLTVLSVSKAEHDPAHAVVARVSTGPGSDPVRVVLSRSGTDAWVTDRSLNLVKVYSTRRLRSDPSHALLARIWVGTAPVGIALIKNGLVAVVANSNRFSATTRPQTLSLLGTADVLTRQPAHLGTLTVGAFPREMAQSADGRYLFVTNFDSDSVTAFDVSRLPDPRE